MSRRISTIIRPVIAALLAVGSSVVVTGVAPVDASGITTTWYVAASGSVGTGASCASPHFVGGSDVSIQAALDSAIDGDTVHLCAGTYRVSTRLNVAKSITIEGESARSTVLDGGGDTQIMILQDPHENDSVDKGSPDATDEIKVNIDTLSFLNGSAKDGSFDCDQGSDCGGAIYIEGETRASITNSYFKNNHADFVGGAVTRMIGDYINAPVTIDNSVFEENSAGLDGGGVATLFGFDFTVSRSTFYRNSIVGSRGLPARSAAALIANFATATVTSSTFVDNLAPEGFTVLYGGLALSNSIVAQPNVPGVNGCDRSPDSGTNTGNLVTDDSCGVSNAYSASSPGVSAVVDPDDLRLGALSYRGYPLKTIPLLAGSAALNYWTGDACTGKDAHGFSVPQGTKCDVGAYERPTAQGPNTISGWNYGTTSFNRLESSTLSTGSVTDAAGRGVDFSTDTPSVCSISASGTITGLAAGTCTVVATAPAWQLFDEVIQSKSITVTSTTPPTTTTVPTTTVPTTTVPNSTTTAPADAGTNATISSGSTTSGTSSGSTRTTLAPSAITPVASVPASSTTTSTIPAPDTPSLSPGESTAVVDGEVVSTTMSRVDNSLVVSGAGIEATIYGLSATGGRISLDADGNLRLQSDDRIVVEAAGYDQGSSVDVWIHSTPAKLGTLTVDGSGNIRGTFSLPTGFESGDHKLVLEGPNVTGQNVVLGIGIAVGKTSSGSVVARVLLAIPVSIAVLLGLVIPTRLRRRRETGQLA